MLAEVLDVLKPGPGQVVVDCTVGAGGHAVELLRRVGPQGRLIGLDLDGWHLDEARGRLEAVGHPFALHQANFAGLPAVLAADGVSTVAAVVADLGMSSMQVDDTERGFSYRRDGPLDMRMDARRGRTAAEILANISEEDLARALADLGDEPEALGIAAAVVAARQHRRLARTGDLVEVIFGTVRKGADWRLHPSRGRWELHPAARTFQALRILVNRELDNLHALLRQIPAILGPGGRAALISFHSGEDRLIKSAFREGLRRGQYAEIAPEPIRPCGPERFDNPRSRSAKLRWAAGILPISEL
jgi:16S rRNA (cytosine1402-N4)-methyltransferase